jgi:hypothetical protein
VECLPQSSPVHLGQTIKADLAILIDSEGLISLVRSFGYAEVNVAINADWRIGGIYQRPLSLLCPLLFRAALLHIIQCSGYHVSANFFCVLSTEVLGKRHHTVLRQYAI